MRRHTPEAISHHHARRHGGRATSREGSPRRCPHAVRATCKNLAYDHGHRYDLTKEETWKTGTN